MGFPVGEFLWRKQGMGNDLYNVIRIIKRKFDTFQRDPIGSTKNKARDQVHWLLSHWGKHKLHQRGALEALVDFLAIRPPSAIPPNFSDLWFLYKTVRWRNPNIILEFGSGCSTVILTQALYDNQRHSSKSHSYLYSVDADPYWAEVTARTLPTHLRKFCEISYSPLLEVEYQGIPGFRHANVPNVVPNLVYLDGPPLTPEREVAVDILYIEDKLPPDFYLIIDGRKNNTMFLKRNLKRRYSFKERKIFFNYIFQLGE